MAAWGRLTQRLLLGLAVVGLCLSGCSSGDRESALGADQRPEASAETAPAQTTELSSAGYENDPAWPELHQDAAAARQLVEAYWVGVMPAVFGRRFLPVAQFFHYEGAKGGPMCAGEPPPAGGAWCCIGQRFVAFDVDWFLENMKSGAGDGSVYVVLFHEWGHAVQEEVGRPSLPINAELQADCYADAALAGAVQAGRLQLEIGDPEEVVTILFQGGDAATTPWFDPAAHGTAEQRIQAF
jgi:predicted metalloprotease